MATDRFTALGAALKDLELAWHDRLKDAEVLLAAKRTAAAMASGLYALEIRLKVMICKKLGLDRLPRAFEIHDLDALLMLAGLLSSMASASVRTRTHWNDIQNMAGQLNALRYTANKKWSQKAARGFIDALTESPDGILPWLSTQ